MEGYEVVFKKWTGQTVSEYRVQPHG